MQTPPAAVNLLLALSENERAHTVIFGTSSNLSSSKTLHTTTATLSPYFFIDLAKKERETGYLLTLDIFNLFRTYLLKLLVLSVLLAKKVYSYFNIRTIILISYFY